MNYLKKFFTGCVVAFVLVVPNVTYVQRAAADTGTLTPEARLLLIKSILVQLVQLQTQLKLLQEKEGVHTSLPVVHASGIISDDYTLGSPTARLQILTYTDLDCPFCKMFHATVHALVASNTNVAVTYRHMPLVQLHPNAKTLAVAAECAGQLGGDAAFWKFTDAIFDSRSDVNAKTDLSKLPSFATAAGISNSAFTACTNGGKAVAAVDSDVEKATAAEVQGTPQSFIYLDGKKVGKIEGAQPLPVVEQLITNLLK